MKMVGLRITWITLALSSSLWSTLHAFVAPKPAFSTSKRTIALNAIYTPKPSNNNNNEHAHFVLQDFAMYNGEIVDPYETLHVDRQATDTTIKKAYRHLCRRCHPDAVRHHAELDDKLVREQWERITWSYELLLNERQRRKYDVHYAVAYPGQTVRRAASALAFMGFAALSKGLVGMGNLARAKVSEYEQAQYQVQQQLDDTHPTGTFGDFMEQQPNVAPQNFFQAALTALTQGFSRFGKMVMAKMMEHHFVRRQEYQENCVDAPMSSRPPPPHFVLEGAGRPIGCQPFQVAMFDDFANMINSIKRFL